MRVFTSGMHVFLSALVVYVFCLNGIWAADHPTALLELSYALWTSHSVVLARVGEYLPGTVDVFAYKGSYYSALAPGASFLALPFVGPGFVLDGGFNQFGYAMFLSELFVAVCNAAAAYLVFKLGSMYFSERTAVFVAFAYAFSTIAWPFATYFFESDVSAMFDLLAVYLAVVMARRGSADLKRSLLCGAVLGTALTVDDLNAVLVPVVVLFLAFSFRARLGALAKGLGGLLVMSALGAAVMALYDQVAFGSPLMTTEQAYDHTSSLFSSFSFPILSGLYVDLLSPMRGIFLYCPLLVLGVAGACLMLRRRELAAEGVFLAACFVTTLVPYAMWYNIAGGEGFGQRFLIPVIPLLLVPMGFVVESGIRRASWLAYVLFLAGVAFNGISAVTTAIPQVEATSQFPFLNEVLPLFLRGGVDTWWWRELGPWSAPLSIPVLLVAAALPVPALLAARRAGGAKSS